MPDTLPDVKTDAPAFPLEEFQARLERTRAGLRARQIDAGLFFAAETIYYLAGYEYPTHAAFQLLVVPVDSQPFLVMRQHMLSGVQATSWLQDCVTFPDTGDPIDTATRALRERKLATARLGFEETAPTLNLRVARALQEALPGAQISDCSGIVEDLRLVKSPREIAYIRRAASVSDAGIAAAREIVRAGVSERDIAIEVTRRMMAAGGEYQTIPLLIGIEERTRLATPLWSSRVLGAGELMWIEVFGTVRRYAAGLKASFGARPTRKDAERRTEIAQRAFRNALNAIVPGRPAADVATAVQETFREAGYAVTPHHQSGYSIGIAFSPNQHEAGLFGLKTSNARPLQAGMTLFPIANLYGPGATISASGMVLVTASGGERLTKFDPLPEDLAR